MSGLVVWALSLEFGQSGADGIELRARTLVDVVLVMQYVFDVELKLFKVLAQLSDVRDIVNSFAVTICDLKISFVNISYSPFVS